MHFFLGNRKLVKADEESAAEGLEGLAKAVEAGVDVNASLKGGQSIVSVNTIDDLKSCVNTQGVLFLDILADGISAYVIDPIRMGSFTWRVGDYSNNVLLDQYGVEFIALANTDGGSGCWVRDRDGYLTPEMFGYDNTIGTHDNLTAWLNYETDLLRKTSQDLDIYYDLIALVSGVNVVIDHKLTAKSGGIFDTGVIVAGSQTTLVDNIHITGKGHVDANFLALRPIDMRRARFSSVVLPSSSNGTLNVVRVGDITAESKSYEVFVSIKEPYLDDVSNVSTGSGIYHEWATDCYIENTVVRGYKKSFSNTDDCASLEYTKCHGWVRPVHGLLTHVFDDNASLSTFVQCYADTPTNYADASITDVYGFYLNGFSPNLIACRAFMNEEFDNDISTDNIVHCVYMAKEIYGNILGFAVAGGSSERRYASIIGGNTETSTLLGIVDGGASTVADASTRNDRMQNLKQVNSFVDFSNGLIVSGDNAHLNANDGESIGVNIQQGNLDRYSIRKSESPEVSTLGGSNLQLVAYDNNGDFVQTVFDVSREYSFFKLNYKLLMESPLVLQSLTVATLPSSADNGAEVYVTDGASDGGPCKSVYSGGAWRRIELGDVIS